MIWPARSDERNKIAEARSDVSASLASGVSRVSTGAFTSPRAAAIACIRGVFTAPGTTALTRILRGASSSAAVRTSDNNAALAAP